MSIERKPGKWVQHLLLPSIRAFVERRSTIVIERNDTRNMKGPYLILGNHVNNWDPIILNCYVNEPVSFIAADPLFRTPFLKHILNYVGAIRNKSSKMTHARFEIS
ncbi:1-acyl-sn-glycerol-3-phosphate acyltransferase [Lentibacillus sp. CBA3610]|uniref:lysophospholipid acyltransferase family protein n=1 Tax=Lentibacillus sp. CBA3610 TaxID=2518176 RepID=UPI0015955143|nr:1-acyl-sn-glycerol-3-phosphate acyltransferase [Lentibacillus sp. CBA3610]